MKRRPFSIVLLVSYLSIFISSILSCVFVYCSSDAIISSLLKDSSGRIAENIYHKFDDLFLSNTHLQESVETINYLDSLAILSADDFFSNNYVKRLKNTLGNFRKTSAWNSELHLYFHNSGLICGETTVDPLDTFTQKFYGEMNLTVKNDLLYNADNVHYYTLVPAVDKKYLLSFVPLTDIDSDNKMTLIIKTDIQNITNSIDNLKDNFLLEYIIMDKNNQPIIWTDYLANANLPAIQSAYYHAGYHLINQHKYTMETYQGKNANLQYIIFISDTQIYAKLSDLKKLTIAALLIICFFEVILIVHFIRQNSKPLHNILNLLNPFEESDTFSEFDTIYTKVNSIIKDYFNTQKNLEQTEQQLNAVLLKNFLLKQSTTAEKKIEDILPYDTNENFRVIVIRFLSLENLFPDYHLSSKEQFAEATFIVKNVFDELLSDYGGNFLCIKQDMVSIIQAEEIEDDLLNQIHNATSFIETHFHIKIQSAISKLADTTNEISNCYYHALSILNHTADNLSESIVTRSFTDISKNAGFYIPHMEQELNAALRSKDLDKCISIIDDVFAVTNNTNLTVENNERYQLTSVLNTIYQYISGLPAEQIEPFIWEMINELYDEKNIPVAKDSIYSILQELCNLKSNQESAGITSKIMNIISDQYANPNLSVSYIADRLNLHNVYLSTSFKGKTGVSLLETIHRYRLDKAKQLMLENPNLKIEDVAVQVGYTTSKTFSRTFKKYEGVTPSAYKETLAEDI